MSGRAYAEPAEEAPELAAEPADEAPELAAEPTEDAPEAAVPVAPPTTPPMP